LKELIQHINAAAAELEKMKASISNAFNESFMKQAPTSNMNILKKITPYSSRKWKDHHHTG